MGGEIHRSMYFTWVECQAECLQRQQREGKCVLWVHEIGGPLPRRYWKEGLEIFVTLFPGAGDGRRAFSHFVDFVYTIPALFPVPLSGVLVNGMR